MSIWVKTSDFRSSPFKPSLRHAPPLPQPSLCHTSPSPTLTLPHVSFLNPHSPMRSVTSFSLPWLVRDPPTLASIASCFPYPDQTPREKVTSLLHCSRVLPLSLVCCTSHHIAPLSCLWSCQTIKNILLF